MRLRTTGHQAPDDNNKVFSITFVYRTKYCNIQYCQVMGKIEVIKGDITHLDVDAIVNAANRSLLGGGGVDGAIHRAAGPGLLKACEMLNGCETGGAKITLGFRLPSKYVIHAVGPVWNGGEYREKELLASCYHESLRIAMEKGLKTIAFPNISTGVYGFPKQEAATIAVGTVRSYLAIHPKIEKVVFCCFDEDNFNLYNELIYNDIEILKVQSADDVQWVAKLAFEIWNEHYVPIIGQQQVDYMVNTFQTADAITKQIQTEGYEYYLIGHISGEPSGYISVKLMGDELFLSKFYVIKEKRGAGLGKEGLKFIIGRAKELGANTIKLTVNKHNTNTIKAYHKMGFVNMGSVVADIGEGYVMDDYVMKSKIMAND